MRLAGARHALDPPHGTLAVRARAPARHHDKGAQEEGQLLLNAVRHAARQSRVE